MTPLDQHDLQLAHDLGTVEGKLAAIYENTKILPELIKKVEKHETQLSLILWGGGTAFAAMITTFFAWVKTHFGWGR